MSNMPYRAGDHKAICDICGFLFYGSELVKNWQGLMVCKKDYEPRHPQELTRPIIEKIIVTNPRPEGADHILAYGEVKASDL